MTGSSGKAYQSGSGARGQLRAHLAVALTYAMLVITVWAWYGIQNGMPFETTLVYQSQAENIRNGFTYADPLRRHTCFFYQLSYLIGKGAGIEGSFVPYQVVYAALWFGRGYLAFMIMRTLFPAYLFLPYLVGALVIFHGSDHALNWVGQLNQFGFIFWLLLSFYLYVAALQASRRSRAAFSLLGACLASYMSLWSYEAGLAVIAAFPILTLAFLVKPNTIRVILTCGYYVIPGVYTFLSVRRYLSEATRPGYQTSILRPDFDLLAIVNDTVFNVLASLKFWEWAQTVPAAPSSTVVGSFALIAVVLFASGGLAIQYASSKPGDVVVGSLDCLVLLLIGASLLVLSFPAYVILDSARSLWRTQFLSGFGASLVLASAACLLARQSSFKVVHTTVLLIFGCSVAIFGTIASLKTGLWHHQIWDRHREAIANVLHVAPAVEQQSLIVLTDVPKNEDPFGHNMWFDVALRLAYPGTAVAGMYFFDDGLPSAGNNIVLRSGKWEQQKFGYPPLLTEAPVSQTVIIRFMRDGKFQLLERVPEVLGMDQQSAKDYNPRRLIKANPISPLAARRYIVQDNSPIASK